MTIVVPARDEADRIVACLMAILSQDVDLGTVEVVVVDGMSSDATVERVNRTLEGRGLAAFRVLQNPKSTRPSNLNVGLAAARGEILIRVDARSLLPVHYVRLVVELLDDRPEVSVVGGAQMAWASGPSPVEVGIARAMNNRWGMGFARYRRASSSGPADTVYLGAFRTEQVRAAGGWDERFVVNEDYELNRRMAGEGLVWFDHRLVVRYQPRGDLRSIFDQYQAFGRGKVRYWRVTGDRPQTRQLLLLGAPAALAVVALLWMTSVRRPIRRGAAIGLSAAVAFEVAGSAEPRGRFRAHIVSAVTSGVVAGGWLSGLWRELVNTSRD